MVKYLKMDWMRLDRRANCFGIEKADCPLHFAIYNADIEFIDIMIKNKLCCIAEEETLTRMARQKLNRSLKLILQTFDFSRDKIQRIFLDSCSSPNLEMLRYLISSGTLDDYSFGQDLVNKGLICGTYGHGLTNVVSFLLQNLSSK